MGPPPRRPHQPVPGHGTGVSHGGGNVCIKRLRDHEAANLPRFVHPAAVARPRRRPGRLPGSHGAYADEKSSCRMITRSLNATALPGAIFGTLGRRQIVVVKEPRAASIGSGVSSRCLAAVVWCPVTLAASREGVAEDTVLLGWTGVPEAGRAAAVRCPCAGAELVRAVVASGIPRLVVATRLTGPHARAERAADCGALIGGGPVVEPAVCVREPRVAVVNSPVCFREPRVVVVNSPVFREPRVVVVNSPVCFREPRVVVVNSPVWLRESHVVVNCRVARGGGGRGLPGCVGHRGRAGRCG